MSNRLRWLAFFLSVWLAGLTVPPAPAWAGSLDGQAQALLRAANLGATEVGLYAVDVASGEVLLDVQGEAPRIPASNMKLVTTAAALDILGPDFVFTTELRLTHDAQGRAVLIVAGDGDPAFGDPQVLAANDLDVEALLDRWVEAVRQAGVSEVSWLVVDDRIFDRDWVHPSWPANQLSRWYCAQVAGLNFHSNCLDVYPRPTAAGQSPLFELSPRAPFITTTNRAVTGSRDQVSVERRGNSNELHFGGIVKQRLTSPVNVTVHDPPVFFARLLQDRLEAVGIKVGAIGRPEPDKRLPAGQVLLVHKTPLAVVLARCNKDSQNLFAEALFKRIGHALTGEPGGWINGAAAVRLRLHQRLGPASAAVTIADGSGMSRDNRISAQALTSLLASLARDSKVGPAFRASLSVAGEDGTLQTRLEQLRGQVLGKSGYLQGVSGLSGYLIFPAEPAGEGPATGGPAIPERVIAFSFLFNDFRPPLYNPQIQAVQDRLTALLDRAVASERTADAAP